jgi:hypothetical protein
MAEIRRAAGRPSIDYLARDYDSILAAMRAQIPAKLPEWTDHADEADFGNVLLQLFAQMGDILSYYQDRVANESFLSTARTRRSVIEHLRLIGYTLGTAAPAAAVLTVILPAGVPLERLVIDPGYAFATPSTDAPGVRFEYAGPESLEIDVAALEPDESGRRTFTLPVEQGRLVRDELLGVSDGSADQRFALHHDPLILRSRGSAGLVNKDVLLRTLAGATVRLWTLRSTLAFSPSDTAAVSGAPRDYTIEIDADDRAVVVFGDGEFGAIPEAGAQVVVSYRVGGGIVGNVAAGRIDTVLDAPRLTRVGAQVTNAAAATGGSDRESIERAGGHAPAVFRSMSRAVSAADYEALALDFPGVAKVRAQGTRWNGVTLHVAPADAGPISDILRANLRAYFEDKRPIGTRIDIVEVSHAEIRVTARIGVLPYYSRAQVEREVRAAAGGVLAFADVDFGRPVYLSKFYEVIEAIDGVSWVNVSEFRRGAARPDDPAEAVAAAPEGPAVEPSGRITPGEHELAVPSRDPGYEGGIRVVVEEGGF